MASFQAKISWKMVRNIINKNYRSVSLQPDKSQKIRKKFKNTITDSFQAKIGWRRTIKKENKNYSSVSFLSDA